MKGQGDIDWNFALEAFSLLVSHGSWQVVFQSCSSARCVWPIAATMNQTNKFCQPGSTWSVWPCRNQCYFTGASENLICTFIVMSPIKPLKGKCPKSKTSFSINPADSYVCCCFHPLVWSFVLPKWVNMLEIIFPSSSTSSQCQELWKLRFHFCW